MRKLWAPLSSHTETHHYQLVWGNPPSHFSRGVVRTMLSLFLRHWQPQAAFGLWCLGRGLCLHLPTRVSFAIPPRRPHRPICPRRGVFVFVFFSSFLPNQLTVNPWHTTSLKGHQTIPVCVYPAERWVRRGRPALTPYQLSLQITPKLTKSQEDKAAVMQALGRAMPDLSEGISSRNFPPFWWEFGCWNLAGGQKQMGMLGEDRKTSVN